MNIHQIEPTRHPIAAQMIREAQERRRRLMGKPVVKNVLVPVCVVKEDPKPQYNSTRNFDAHVHAYRQWRAELPTKLRSHLIRFCAANHYPLSWITIKRRRKDIVAARQAMMHELRTVYQTSYPQIAIIMGGIDHSTVVHGVRQHIKRVHGELLPRTKPLPPAPEKMSQVIGVNWRPKTGKWDVSVCHQNKRYYFGCWPDLEEAEAEALKHHKAMNSQAWVTTRGLRNATNSR